MEPENNEHVSEWENTTAQIDRLRSENGLLSAYIERLAPDIAEKVKDYVSNRLPQISTDDPGANSFDEIMAELQLDTQKKVLSIDEKYEIAFTELELARDELDKAKEESERMLDELRAKIEEAETSIAETKRDSAEFQRDVIVLDENYLTDKPTGERFGHYMEERLKKKTIQKKKLHEKNLTLRRQIKKIEQKLLQREEMGEVLHVIDFEQMKIENHQFLEKIEERNDELLTLKLTTGKIVQVLNNYKKKLTDVTARGEWLHSQMKERMQMLGRCKNDLKKVSHDKKLAQALNQRLKSEERNDDLPYVIDYIRLKAEAREVEAKAKDLHRKVEVTLKKKCIHTRDTTPKSTQRLEYKGSTGAVQNDRQ